MPSHLSIIIDDVEDDDQPDPRNSKHPIPSEMSYECTHLPDDGNDIIDDESSSFAADDAEDEDDEPACPTCHTPLPPDTEECPACARAQPPQTSTWVLLRLWRFARPYRKQLATGFALTLASTAATLVPLAGSFITEPEAMTLAALLLRNAYFCV